MTTNFRNSSVPVLDEDLKKIQLLIGFSLPNDFKEFYKLTNGGVPEPDCWPGNDYLEPVSVSKFLNMKEDAKGGNTLENTLKNAQEKGILPAGLLPFALDWGNNYFCIDSQGQVYYLITDSWHEDLTVAENIKKNTKKLLCGFNDFIDSLEDEE